MLDLDFPYLRTFPLVLKNLEVHQPETVAGSLSSTLRELATKVEYPCRAVSLIRDITSTLRDIESEREETKRYAHWVDLAKEKSRSSAMVDIARISADRDIRVAGIQADAQVECAKTYAVASVMRTALECGAVGGGHSEIEYSESRCWGGRKWKLKVR